MFRVFPNARTPCGDQSETEVRDELNYVHRIFRVRPIRRTHLDVTVVNQWKCVHIIYIGPNCLLCAQREYK